MTKNVIITYLNSKYINNFIKDFVPTLFTDAKYGGKLCVLGYGLTDREKRMILTLNDNIIVKDCVETKQIEVQRNYDILNTIKDLDADVIMTIDAGDVWFQDDFHEIFELCKDKIGVVAESELCSEN